MTATSTRSTARARRSRGRRSISRHDVLVAALDLVDRDGLDELSMRKLAAELDMETMSLYKRVASKDELLAGIADLVWSEAVAGLLPGDLSAWLRSFGHSIVATMRAHPKAVPVLLANKVWPPAVLDAIATEVEWVTGGRLQNDDVYTAVCAVSAFALGCATLERSYLDTATRDSVEDQVDGDVAERQRFRRVVRALPADTPDRLVDTAMAVCGCDSTDLFDVGLELIIRGCQLDTSVNGASALTGPETTKTTGRS